MALGPPEAGLCLASDPFDSSGHDRIGHPGVTRPARGTCDRLQFTLSLLTSSGNLFRQVLKLAYAVGVAYCAGLVCAAVCAPPLSALNPAHRISQYLHTAWKSDSGLQAVRRLAQTPDALSLAGHPQRPGPVRRSSLFDLSCRLGSRVGKQHDAGSAGGSGWLVVGGNARRGHFPLPAGNISLLYDSRRPTFGRRAVVVSGHARRAVGGNP